MTSRKNTVSTLLASVGVAAVLAIGAVTPSLAAATRIQHTRAYDARAYDAQAYAGVPRAERQLSGGRYFAHGAPDDPPGSAFQSFGNDQAMGKVR
jgi:hypothetical protein